MRKQKRRYHVTYLIPLKYDEVQHKFFSKRVKARRFIETMYPHVLACWVDYASKDKHTTERIFRNIYADEPKEYWNNVIKAKVKRPHSIVSD